MPDIFPLLLKLIFVYIMDQTREFSFLPILPPNPLKGA
jgi:hypothetical protein